MATKINEVMELLEQLTDRKSREAAAIYAETLANGWDAGYEAGFRAAQEKAAAQTAEAGAV